MFDQHSERRAIFISDFLNPHCFHFKFYDEKFNEQLKLFEDDLAEHAWAKIKKNSNSNVNWFQPKQNDIIAVYNISWSKWVRAVIKKVYFPEQEGKQYVLWATDHGQYIKSFDKNSILPLPVDLRNFNAASVYQGSIHGYGPAILELNKECLEEEMIPTKDWSPRAMQMCKELIVKSPTVYFDVKATHGGYRFGDLHFQMPDNRLVSLEKCLSDLRQIVRGDFNEEMIANQYSIQTDVLTSNTNQIVKQTENSPYISSRGRSDGAFWKNYTNQPKHMQYQRKNRDGHETKNYMEAQKVRMTGPPMSVLESEIDGGITRIRMDKRL